MDNTFVANRIKTLRESKKLSGNALANLAGVSPTYIYQLEQGLKSPTVEYLSYICDALDISLSEFFFEDSSADSRSKKLLDELSEDQIIILSELIKSFKK